MNKLLIATLLCISSISGANAALEYTCTDKDYIQYEIESLAEEAKDPQFDTPTRMQIVDEYYHMATQAKLLATTCQPKDDNEFTLNGITYIVVTEYNTNY